MRPNIEIHFQKYVPDTLIDDIETALGSDHAVIRKVMGDQHADHFESVDVMDVIVYIDKHSLEWTAGLAGNAAYDIAKTALLAILWASVKLGRSAIRKLSGGQRSEPAINTTFQYANVDFEVTLKGNVDSKNVDILAAQLLNKMKGGEKQNPEISSTVGEKPRIRFTFDPINQVFIQIDDETLRKRAEANRAALLEKLKNLPA